MKITVAKSSARTQGWYDASCGGAHPCHGTATTSRFIRVNYRWIDTMTTLAFVAGILLGGNAGLLLALFVRGMGDAAGGL
jgi:hypothetical protein